MSFTRRILFVHCVLHQHGHRHVGVRLLTVKLYIAPVAGSKKMSERFKVCFKRWVKENTIHVRTIQNGALVQNVKRFAKVGHGVLKF